MTRLGLVAAAILASGAAQADVKLTKTRFKLDCDAVSGACFVYAYIRVRNEERREVRFDAVCRVYKAKDEYLQTIFGKFSAPPSSESEYTVWGYHSWGAVRADCNVRS